MGEFWIDTPFHIDQVIKGEYSEKEITIAQAFLKLEDKIRTFEGFSPMLENAKYILYLKKSSFGVTEGNEYSWNTISGNYGKYNLDDKDRLEDIHSLKNHKKLKDKLKKEHKNK